MAKKTGYVFGAVIVVLVGVTIAVPWLRLNAIVDNQQIDQSRQVAELWASNPTLHPSLSRWVRSPEIGWSRTGDEIAGGQAEGEKRLINNYEMADWQGADFSLRERAFERQAREAFEEDATRSEYWTIRHERSGRHYLYARRILAGEGYAAPPGVIVVERTSATAESQLFVDRVYLVIAAFVAIGVSISVLYVMMRRVVLRPMGTLRQTADAVAAGRLHVRAHIDTGDEFQQLAETFNAMLASIEDKQRQMRGMNKTLDLKLTELAERNVALFEAARVKGEFLASVSHELRTPLNSIIGFAEILQDGARIDADRAAAEGKEDASMAKRLRYLDNIVTAGRSLLEMINELLTMARIDAGTVKLNISPVSISEVCDGLQVLISPLADRKEIAVSVELPPGGASELPIVQTDQQKVQQVVFNFLSNAVKFTPEGGRVQLRVEQLAGFGPDDDMGAEHIRISVLDNGPGIPDEEQQVIFERFHQLDSGMTREHTGTGLGLAISKELAEMLGGSVQLESEVGRGSMFSLVLPTVPPAQEDSKGAP